jgi:ParB family chromosome partitioning protein
MIQNQHKKGRAQGGTRRRKKPAGASVGLSPPDLLAETPPDEVVKLGLFVEQGGGEVLKIYREPYGGRWLIVVALAIDSVEATPFQRNLSDAHVRKLESVIAKLGRFLDPIVVVRAGGETEERVKYWTPNGHHRLAAMRNLGARSILALLVPESKVAFQMLALNTEKAHNLREKALEVIRMYRELSALDTASEESYALEFEEPALITLGLCYAERPRFSGGAYHPVLRRVDQFLKRSLATGLPVRQARAKAVMELDDVVVSKVEALKARGLTSPYLKSFVVARVNPIRFRPSDAASLSFDEAIERMSKAATKFNAERVRIEDLARSGGALEEVS